ncbi:hypothetical protein FOA52_002605 [Chlamydomonas sp. UWO 241]|nr:hypothetical protein FOA52_002605 [Chlamydomonas sp. UWO 241]
MAGNKVTFASLEDSLLNGQKLQGVLTSNEVQEILEIRGWEKTYPLFSVINAIVNGKVSPVEVTHFMGIGVLPKGVKTKAGYAPKAGEKKRGPVDLVFTVDELADTTTDPTVSMEGLIMDIKSTESPANIQQIADTTTDPTVSMEGLILDLKSTESPANIQQIKVPESPAKN